MFVYYDVHKNRPLCHVMSHFNPVCTLIFLFLEGPLEYYLSTYAWVSQVVLGASAPEGLEPKYNRVLFCNSSFTTIHFYGPCPDESSTPDLWCITVATQVSFFYLCASSSFPVCMCFFFFCFSAVILSWLWFFHPWRPPKDRKEEKIKTVDVSFFLDVFWITARAFFNKIKSDLTYIFPIICAIFYIPNSLN